MYLYKFINLKNEIIYIGRTNNIIRRLRNEHFTSRGHLPQACYNETFAVEIAAVNTQNDAKMYELYYIEKYHPKYNKSDIGGGAFSFEPAELNWQPFQFDTDTGAKSKQDVMNLVSEFNQEIDSECRFAENILRKKDDVVWLDKLNTDEKNEYLRMVYSMERFLQNVSDHNKKVIEALT